MKNFIRNFMTKLQKRESNSAPAPSRGGLGHSGSKSMHSSHSRPFRVAKRKAARLARRRNRA